MNLVAVMGHTHVDSRPGAQQHTGVRGQGQHSSQKPGSCWYWVLSTQYLVVGRYLMAGSQMRERAPGPVEKEELRLGAALCCPEVLSKYSLIFSWQALWCAQERPGWCGGGVLVIGVSYPSALLAPWLLGWWHQPVEVSVGKQAENTARGTCCQAASGLSELNRSM